MKVPKLAWIVAGALFVAGSIAIHYEVKIRMHTRSGSVREFGPWRLGERAPDVALPDRTGSRRAWRVSVALSGEGEVQERVARLTRDRPPCPPSASRI
ncbi:MAG TPA: hypothetical protein VJ376_16110 [Pseudomonadota bacterium]|nr:hypothetical protein [Pseudomonadota bacterium]